MTIETYKNIIEHIKQLIKGSKFEGHVYSVGGCERDKHLGLKEIKDIDLTIDLEHGGIDFANWLFDNGFTSSKVVIYENFGTAMFRLKEFPNEEIESVFTRKEIYRDKNSRNPETSFGTIKDDCIRRDFTINSLYHNISLDEDLDLTGKGIEDLHNGIIRTCDNPNIIFSDDSLRIMRAARFSAKLGFIIDNDVFEAMKRNIERLKIISQERITDEFNKILMSGHPYIGLSYLNDIGFFDTITPYLFTYENGERNEAAKEGAFETVLEIISKYEYDLETLLGGFVQNWYCESKQRNKFLKEFKYSNDTINKVNFYAMKAFPLELACKWKLGSKIREIVYECDTIEDFNHIVAIAKSFPRLKDGNWVFNFLKTIDIEEMIGYKLPVNGDDIMEIRNIKPGKEVKKILDYLFEEAFKNPKITRDECVEIVKNLNYNGWRETIEF